MKQSLELGELPNSTDLQEIRSYSAKRTEKWEEPAIPEAHNSQLSMVECKGRGGLWEIIKMYKLSSGYRACYVFR